MMMKPVHLLFSLLLVLLSLVSMLAHADDWTLSDSSETKTYAVPKQTEFQFSVAKTGCTPPVKFDITYPGASGECTLKATLYANEFALQVDDGAQKTGQFQSNSMDVKFEALHTYVGTQEFPALCKPALKESAGDPNKYSLPITINTGGTANCVKLSFPYELDLPPTTPPPPTTVPVIGADGSANTTDEAGSSSSSTLIVVGIILAVVAVIVIILGVVGVFAWQHSQKKQPKKDEELEKPEKPEELEKPEEDEQLEKPEEEEGGDGEEVEEVDAAPVMNNDAPISAEEKKQMKMMRYGPAMHKIDRGGAKQIDQTAKLQPQGNDNSIPSISSGNRDSLEV